MSRTSAVLKYSPQPESSVACSGLSEDTSAGAVARDLVARRGEIQETETSGPVTSVRALVPLAEMFGYATSVRSMSQGRATFTMEFARYLEVPNNVAEAVMKKAS